MDKMVKYQQIIQQLLQEYAAISSQEPEIETQFIFDTERHHYQLVNVGWKNDRRIYGCFLLNLGIPQQDIVIGFHSPFKRQFTDYAVG